MKTFPRSPNNEPIQRLFCEVLIAALVALTGASANAQEAQGLHLPEASNADLSAPVVEAKQLIAGGQFKQAEDALRRSLAKGDRSAEAHYLLAYALLRQGRAKEALEEYTRAAALRTPTAGELTDVGKAYVLLQDYDDAGKWMLRAVAISPSDAEAWYSLGRLRFTQQRFEEAADCFKRALALAPGSVKAENNLGLAYDGLNRADDAIAAYRQAVAWQDAGPASEASEQPLLNLGIALEEQGKLSEARSLLLRAEAIAPKEPRIHEHLGQVAMQQGDLPAAAKEFENAIRLDPEKSNLHFLLGQAYRRLGRQEDAKAEFDRAAQLNGTPPQP